MSQKYDLQHPLTEAEIEGKKLAERNALHNRVTQLEHRVIELEKKAE